LFGQSLIAQIGISLEDLFAALREAITPIAPEVVGARPRVISIQPEAPA